MAYLQFETKKAVDIIPLNLKIQQKRPLLVCSLFSKEIFWKFTLLLKCLRAANERWTFSRTDSVLILKIGWVEPLSLSFWKLLEEAVFENGAGYSRIYLSYLGCKFDLFTCLLVFMVMIKTNTTRKQPRIKRSPYGNLPGCKQGTDVS